MADLPGSAGRVCWSGCVGPEDIDENRHMNVRAYDRVLEATDMAFFYEMGWSPDYPRVAKRGFFRLEKHVRYEAELLEGTPLVATAWMVERDMRRFRIFFQLWHSGTGRRSATMETMLIHMDLVARRPVALEDPVQCRAWEALACAQSGIAPPDGTGRRVSMERQ